jgi:hypothetical protein
MLTVERSAGGVVMDCNQRHGLQLQLVGHDQDHTRLVNARDRLFRQRNAIEIALGRHLPKHVIRELEAREGIGLRNYPDAG